MCQMTTIVSGAISFGVLAGVITGIVYVLLFGLKWVGKLRVSLEEEAVKSRKKDNFLTESLCIRCRHENGRLSNGSDQSCDNSSCNGIVCSDTGNHVRKRGSRRISENWSEDKDGDTVDSEDFNEDPKTVMIREEMEKLVEKMVGGSLDGVSVGKLSRNSSYVGMFGKYHEPLCQELANLGYALHLSLNNKNGFDYNGTHEVHSKLKSLVEKVYMDAVKLPDIQEIIHPQNSAEETGSDNNFSNKSYEDILATAILNKIIEQCQKRRDEEKKKKEKKTLRNCNNNIIYNENDGENGDEVYNSDWSESSIRSEQLSLTIEEHIEEITTTYENSDEEDINDKINFNGAIPFPESGRIILNGDRGESEEDGDCHSSMTELITTGSSWEENWLFQRKRLRSGAKSHHPVPVPMLVPNPSQDFRAMIGDVDADDLSDMSECSDSLLQEVVLASEKGDDEEGDEQEAETREGESTEEDVVNGNGLHDAGDGEEIAVESSLSLNSDTSCPSLSQKERDVSVDYECFRKCEIELRDPPLPRPRSFDVEIMDKEEAREPVKCRIAEREKEKWMNPIQLADNPYSQENILKREQRRRMDYYRSNYRSDESALEFPCDSPVEETNREIYDRAYYIKASRCPAGGSSIRSTPEVEDFVQEKEEEISEKKPEDPIREIGTDEPGNKLIRYCENGLLRKKIKETTNVTLPDVKELAKRFAQKIDEFTPKPSPSPSAANHETAQLKSERVGKCDTRSNSPLEKGRTASDGGESPGKGVDTCQKALKSSTSTQFGRNPGKEVHSLTARSISKEFREELRNNSGRRSAPKVDRGSSGENDRGEILSGSARNRSPTPQIDLQSKKKFWEDVISNAQK